MKLPKLDLILYDVELHLNGTVHKATVSNGSWFLYHDGNGNWESHTSSSYLQPPVSRGTLDPSDFIPEVLSDSE